MPTSSRAKPAHATSADVRAGVVIASGRSGLERPNRIIRSARALVWDIVAVALYVLTAPAIASSVTFTWNPVATSAVAGYMLHYGPATANYTSRIDVGKSTSWTVSNLNAGATYHFAVTAYDASHTESPYSNDVALTIAGGTPVANFTASATSGPAPLALNFANTSTGNISSYQWSFGDGTTSTAPSPSHVYASAGTYTVSMTVSGVEGSNTKIAAGLIRVSAPAGAPTTAPTSTQVTAVPNPAVAGSAVTLNAVVSGNAPSGTVQFTDNGVTIAGCGAVALSATTRTALCTTSALGTGTHAIAAKFSGNASNAASTSAALSEVVNATGSINV